MKEIHPYLILVAIGDHFNLLNISVKMDNS